MSSTAVWHEVECGGYAADLPVWERLAAGRDVSWVWDADFELLAGRVRHVACAGTRAAEMAVRLKYAGLPVAQIEVVPDLERAFDRTIALAPPGGEVTLLPTYTAMLELREILVDRQILKPFWES